MYEILDCIKRNIYVNLGLKQNFTLIAVSKVFITYVHVFTLQI